MDLDSGRVEASDVTTLPESHSEWQRAALRSWKHRACLVQKGLKVRSHDATLQNTFKDLLTWFSHPFKVESCHRLSQVLSFCVEEGRKSHRPIPGSAYFWLDPDVRYGGLTLPGPGDGQLTSVSRLQRALEVDFELIGSQILRQRVPQDWVLLAATSREIKDVAWSLLESRWASVSLLKQSCEVWTRSWGSAGTLEYLEHASRWR